MTAWAFCCRSAINFSKVADERNIRLGNEREYGVGMFFFPQNEHMRAQAMKLFEVVTRKEGLEFLAWRKVPVDPDAVGQKARDCMPSIWQCFIKKPAKVSKGIDFDRKLYVVRRVFEQASNGTYVPSLSSRTIVYKGMFLVHDLRRFYADLQDPDYESAIGMVHSRFSTNTNPSWMRAHPNRFILHNGEINTIKGNTDAMLAREESIWHRTPTQTPPPRKPRLTLTTPTAPKLPPHPTPRLRLPTRKLPPPHSPLPRQCPPCPRPAPPAGWPVCWQAWAPCCWPADGSSPANQSIPES